MDKREIKEKRIRFNEDEMKKSEQRKFKYRIIQCSIASAALFSSACAYTSYRLAPVGGAVFEGESEVLPDNSNIHYDEDFMLPNGRFVTKDSVHKEYSVDAYDVNGDDYHDVQVDLPTIARGTESNHMLLSENVNIGDDMYVNARTVPAEAHAVKCQSIISTSLITGLLSEVFLQNKINDEVFYKDSLKSKNRKLRRSLR